jgi:zinc protease
MRSWKLKHWIGGLFVFMAFSLPVQAKVTEFTLENGMKVLVKEDHRAPVVVHQVWYRTGSNYEVNGTTGIAHMLEHMMFKGTKTLKPGEFSKRVSQMGGQENAFTSTDYTAYFQTVGKSHLEDVMRLEADRMHNLVFDEKEFQKERDVVAEERRWRVEDKPSAKLYEQFMAAAFVNSPLHHPTIGWMTDIQHYTLDDVRNWYLKWYLPNNATLIVVGDVDPDDVKDLAEKYYGAIKPGPIVPPKPQTEIKQSGTRKITLKEATEIPTVILGFHVPSLPNAKDPKEVYALSVLASVLDGDDSSRLLRELVRKQKIALSAGAGYDETSRLPPLFLLEGSPTKGQSLETIQKALLAQIDQLKTQLIQPEEFQRVLAHAESQYIYQQDSVVGQAMLLGSLVSVGLPADTLDQWVENLRAVTPQQVQAVAKKYFTPENMTVGYLLPNGQKGKKERPGLTMGGALR